MNAADEPDQWICLHRTRDRNRVAEAGLVLTAVGIENLIDRDAGDWCLWVPSPLAAQAGTELDKYHHENTADATRRQRIAQIDSGWPGVFGYLLVIWALPALQATTVLGWNWYSDGRMQAGLVMDGQWWRTITALTLHADLGHIVANSVFGVVFGLFLGRYLGSGLGWLLVLGSGAAGNALNAWLQPARFTSIGASTATFAALGVVAAFVWRRGHYRNIDWRRSFAPIFGAIALLAFTGVGGPRTDIVAHFLGFVCGIAAGIVTARFDVQRLGPGGQRLAGAAAVGLVVLAWLRATGAVQ